MTLSELRYLVALADHRHFGRAAEACHITQPTLSTQIRKLESYLGQTLVDRQGKEPALTPMGEQIVERARRLLAEAEAILAVTRARRGPLEGTLTLGVIPSLAPYYLPHLLELVRKAHPKLHLVIHEGFTADLCQQLDEQTLDAALLAMPRPLAQHTKSTADCRQCESAVQTLPSLLDAQVYEEQILFDEPFWVAAPLGHPIAADDVVDASALGAVKLLLLTDAHCLRGQTLEVCHRSGVHPDDAADCRATSMETLIQLVAAGRGCTLLPALAARQVDQTRLSIQRLRGGEHRRIGLVWRRAHPRAHEIALLAQSIRKAPPMGTVSWGAVLEVEQHGQAELQSG